MQKKFTEQVGCMHMQEIFTNLAKFGNISCMWKLAVLQYLTDKQQSTIGWQRGTNKQMAILEWGSWQWYYPKTNHSECVYCNFSFSSDLKTLHDTADLANPSSSNHWGQYGFLSRHSGYLDKSHVLFKNNETCQNTFHVSSKTWKKSNNITPVWNVGVGP